MVLSRPWRVHTSTKVLRATDSSSRRRTNRHPASPGTSRIPIFAGTSPLENGFLVRKGRDARLLLPARGRCHLAAGTFPALLTSRTCPFSSSATISISPDPGTSAAK